MHVSTQMAEGICKMEWGPGFGVEVHFSLGKFAKGSGNSKNSFIDFLP